MYRKTIHLTTGFMAGLVVIAVMAPGAPSQGKKREGGRQTKPASSAAASAALVAEEHTLFLTNCAPCHGADAEGDDGPSLHNKSLSDPFISTAVKNGFKDEMPPFGSKLKAPEVKALVAYVHSLQKKGKAAANATCGGANAGERKQASDKNLARDKGYDPRHSDSVRHSRTHVRRVLSDAHLDRQEHSTGPFAGLCGTPEGGRGG